MRRCTIAAVLLLAFPAAVAGQRPAYRDPSLPVERRVADLLGRMTPDEKFWQLFMVPGDRDDPSHDWSDGAYGLQIRSAPGDSTAGPGSLARRIAAVQHFFRDSTRLGIPILPFEEALHGVSAPGATAFPQAIALAATWDTALVRSTADAIAEEAQSLGIRQVLSPVVNIVRDPRWGRTEESYGEDPLLASAMAVSFVSPFERRGIVTTPKHFVANVGDGGRDSWPIEVSERQLREVWFPPFRAAIERGGSRSVMSAYNSVDGDPASQSRHLLTEVLRDRWGFGGVVISDAAATGGSTVLHMTEGSTASAARDALAAGLDVIFQSSWEQHRAWLRPFLDGTIPDSLIDRAVRRVLRLKFELGLFDQPIPDPDSAVATIDRPARQRWATQVAATSMVLLHNAHDLLPLAPAMQRIAVIGEDAEEARLGGYSRQGHGTINIVEGFRRQGDGRRVSYTPGPGRSSEVWTGVPATAFDGGLRTDVFDNPSLEGTPRDSRVDQRIDAHWTFNGPARGVRTDWYGVRWSGTLRVPADRARHLAIEGDDGYRLWVDDSLVLDHWEPVSYHTREVPVTLAAGSRHAIRLEYHESSGEGRMRLMWDDSDASDDEQRIADAVSLARQNDVAVVTVGVEEGEFRDRSSLALPGRQEELIRRVAATGTPVVVVIIGGSPVTMPWLEQVGAVLMAWYPGDYGGDAVAKVLDGQADPGGRLPITFPMAEGQLPLWYGHKPTGRGNDYLDLTGRPLFPFGFGMSYGRYRYDALRITPDTIGPADSAVVTFRVTNVGEHRGREVPQLYLHDELTSVAQPVLALRHWAVLDLDPGASREVRFVLGPEDLSLLDRDLRRVVEPGRFAVTVGRSSREMLLRGAIVVQTAR